jgi:hypothetical protein
MEREMGEVSRVNIEQHLGIEWKDRLAAKGSHLKAFVESKLSQSDNDGRGGRNKDADDRNKGRHESEE